MITPRHTPLKSQNDRVKAHMLAGHDIDTWQAYKLLTITCLAQRIYDLKKAGVPILSKMVTRNGKRFCVYWIEAEDRSSFTNDHSRAIKKLNDSSAISSGTEAPSNGQ